MLDAYPINPIPPAQDGPITDFGPVKSAWLRDSEGNILALNELAPEFRSDG
jgi:hypothetical protein